MAQMTKDEYIYRCQRKYNWISYEDLDDCYELAKEELLNAIYISDFDETTEVPYRYQRKLLDVMFELIDHSDARHFTSYSENGVSWTKAAEGLTSLHNILAVGEIY